MTPAEKRRELLARFYRNRPLAHDVLFKHRHPQASPPFHRVMINDFHGPAKGVVDFVFRGGAKSTTAEEAVAIMAGFREFGNCLIIGENEDRAASRLGAIRRELETNTLFLQTFGDLRGDTWGADRLVLSTGVCIQALGSGQSLRGIKHDDQRPDLVFGDDLENRDDVATPERRPKKIDWWSFDVMPAMDPAGRWRMAATPLHPESLPETLAKDLEVITHRFPWYYLHPETGEPASSWPERFPVDEILKTEATYRRRGRIVGFNQEFMCQSESPEMKPFKPDMIRVEPQIRTWQAVYSFTDPARAGRSARRGASTTGRVVWSWIHARLVVWDAVGTHWAPDEIVDDLFAVNTEYQPTWMGVEEDGLNEFLMQPIRQQQATRGVVLPIQGLRAPLNKTDFIRGLQPFFKAGEVIFAKELPTLKEQLMGFPTGEIDVPNALAYAMKLRPGAPMYDDFGARHIAEDMAPVQGSAVWLCLNATKNMVTGQLAQVHDGSLRVFWDVVREGEPVLLVSDVIREAQVQAMRKVKLAAGPIHFDQYANVGLAQAVRKIPMDISTGTPPERARLHMRQLLQRERHGRPMLMVAADARWTARAMAGGYARQMLPNGALADEPEKNLYRTLMEGLESFVGLLELGGSTEDDDASTFNAVTPAGVRYRSMLKG